MNAGDIYDSPWGRWFVRRTAPLILLVSLERSNAYVETAELGAGFTATGEQHADRGDEAPAPAVRPPEASERVAGPVLDWGHAGLRGTGGASHWIADLPPLLDPDPLTLGGQRPGSVRARADELQWVPCMGFVTIVEGDRRYLGTHAWFQAPLVEYSLRCPECTAIAAAPRRTVAFAGRPTGPVAIVRGQKVTIDELLADVARCLGSREPEPRKILPADDPREDVAVWDRVIPLVVYSNYIPATVRDEDEEIGERAAMFQHLAGYDRDTATTMGRTLVKRYRKPAPKAAPAAQQGFSFVAELDKLLKENA